MRIKFNIFKPKHWIWPYIHLLSDRTAGWKNNKENVSWIKSSMAVSRRQRLQLWVGLGEAENSCRCLGAWVPRERGKGSQRAQIQTWLSSGFSRDQPVLGVTVLKEWSVSCRTEKLALNQLHFRLHAPGVLSDICMFTYYLSSHEIKMWIAQRKWMSSSYVSD